MKITPLFILIVNMALGQNYTFPDEAEQHEGTWLAWPHQYEYGMAFRTENDATWVAMTNALQANEKVHILVYNNTEKTRIINLLNTASVPLTNVDFTIKQTNDVWTRDMAGVFLRDTSGNLVLSDWGFNGWGGDYNFNHDNTVPIAMGTTLSMTALNLNGILTVENGAYEMDGAGTFIATKSAILTQTNPLTPSGILAIRNAGKTQSQVESIFAQYLGATKFIWLDGWFSADDITDAHIDGFAKFAPGNKLVTMSQSDLIYWGMSQKDIDTLYNSSNTSNVVYTKVIVPLTANDVLKTDGTLLGYKGSYANYYVANNLVLVPNYNDSNDSMANSIIGSLYPGRTVVGIDVRNLYGNGGMVHCVTQQQPLPSTAAGVIETKPKELKAYIYPNPFYTSTTIQFNTPITDVDLLIINAYGQQVKEMKSISGQNVSLFRDNLPTGLYFIRLIKDSKVLATKKLLIQD